MFLTNILEFAATAIGQIYKSLRQIELGFKWIKYDLKIKLFLGTDKNTVLTQVCWARCYLLFLIYIKY